MITKSQIIRLLISGLVVLPAKVLFWTASAYAIILALNLMFGARPLAPETQEHFAASLGFAILGCSLVMCGAALTRKPDEGITAHQAAKLAALDAFSEGILYAACILGIGTFLSYTHGDSASGQQLAIGFIASILCLWMVRRLEKKHSDHGNPRAPEIRQPEE
jgi:hypothetical protein